MINYYKFSNIKEDYNDAFKYYNSFNTNELKKHLDDMLMWMEDNLNECADTFKIIFNGLDDDDYYYICKCLSEDINNIKIILNILKYRDINKHDK